MYKKHTNLDKIIKLEEEIKYYNKKIKQFLNKREKIKKEIKKMEG